LPTVLVEGKHDLKIFNKIERKINLSHQVSIFPCFGKKTLLNVYDKRNEIANINLLFIADKDGWVFSTIPSKYNDIEFTKGYCMENDLFEDGYKLMISIINLESKTFYKIISSISSWFAYLVDKNGLTNGDKIDLSNISINNPNIMKKGSYILEEAFITSNGYFETPLSLSRDIFSNYVLKLKGKFIFQAFEKIVVEKKITKYNTDILLDLCFVTGTSDGANGTNMKRYIDKILAII